MKSYRVCPTCGTKWEETVFYCPHDQSSLVWIDPKDTYAGRSLENRYRLLDRIGRGGVGAVYRALHFKMRKIVAIKILHKEYVDHPEFAGRFRREARAASRLEHPHIVIVTDFGTIKTLSYLVMEFLEGKSLGALLAKDKQFAPGRAASILDQTLAALGHAHERGVIHRDLKSQNVFITYPIPHRLEHAKLLDFGFAKITHTPSAATTLITQPGIVFGTPAYISPEQGMGNPVDERTDLYAAGVLAFEMFTGQRPFDANNAADLVIRHIQDAPPRPGQLVPSMSSDLENVILTALAKKPDVRFGSANEFRHALRNTPEWEMVHKDLAPVPLPPVSTPTKEPSQSIPSQSSTTQDEKKAESTMQYASSELPVFTTPLQWKSFGFGLFVSLFILVFGLLFWLGPWKQPAIPATPRPTQRVEALLAEGNIEAAEVALRQLTSQRQDPYAFYLLGNLYMSRSWWSDGLDEYEQAISLQPSLLEKKALLENTVKALQGKTQQRAKALLRLAGDQAIDTLLDATKNKNPLIRTAAIELLQDLGEEKRIDYLSIALLELTLAASCEEKQTIVQNLVEKFSEKHKKILVVLYRTSLVEKDQCLEEEVNKILQQKNISHEELLKTSPLLQ